MSDQPRKNETVVIINPKAFDENCRLPESVIKKFVAALKKNFSRY